MVFDFLKFIFTYEWVTLKLFFVFLDNRGLLAQNLYGSKKVASKTKGDSL